MDNKQQAVRLAIPLNPKKQELREIKARQVDRKNNKPDKVTDDLIYQMLADILENQARFENALNEIIAKLP